ncbi:MAG: hypothetical protein O9313_18915 [Acetobacteraceae bacterium]|nr:hypothetical protein [Acetobacteraceae bacterium]
MAVPYAGGVTSGQGVLVAVLFGMAAVEVSVIFDFGVGAIDWRGAWFNPGV